MSLNGHFHTFRLCFSPQNRTTQSSLLCLESIRTSQRDSYCILDIYRYIKSFKFLYDIIYDYLNLINLYFRISVLKIVVCVCVCVWWRCSQATDASCFRFRNVATLKLYQKYYKVILLLLTVRYVWILRKSSLYLLINWFNYCFVFLFALSQ